MIVPYCKLYSIMSFIQILYEEKYDVYIFIYKSKFVRFVIFLEDSAHYITIIFH